MRIVNKTIYFWGKDDVFSNHYIHIMNHNNNIYNCSEQYFMYKKALLFNDTEIANQILNEQNPGKYKKLGRQIKNFDQRIWDKNKYNIMYEACYTKFHNTKLKSYLDKYKGYTFVEASPFDKIWGVGLSENDDKILDKNSWNGQNIFGNILTKIFE